MAEDPPALVVLAHADSYRIVDRRGRTIRGRKRVSTWRNKLQATVASLPEASDVLVFGDAPNNAGHVVRCLKRHRSDMSACTMRRESRSERTIERALQQGAVRSGAAFRTLYGKVCTYDPCPLVQGRVLMWRDASHLTQTITERLAPSVEMLLNEVLEEFAAKRVTSDR
jgi:hypothetical protein